MRQKTLKRIIFLVAAGLLLWQWACMSLAGERGRKMGEIQSEEIGLQEMIERVNDKMQQKILTQFKNTLQDGDTALVTEFEDHYEITVVHTPEDGYTGGAEGYSLDKKTGKVEMLWHEHPMEIPELNDVEEIKHPGTDDSGN